MIFLIFAVTALSSPPASISPESGYPLWADDILVWDMSENSTWAGPGLTYCTGICDCQGKLYCGGIIDSYSSGSVFRIYSSSDTGQTWEFESNLSGGSWYLTDPEMATSLGDPPDYLFCLYAATSDVTQPKGIRFTLPEFQFDGFLNPSWPAVADTLRSVEAICHPESGDLWVFGNDSAHNIFLTRSTDNGVNWSTAEQVASNATLPSAASGPQGYVYLSYRRVSDSRIMCLSFGETSYFETEVADGCDTSAPVVASEKSGDEVVAVVFHDAGDNVRMALSYTSGAQWTAAEPLASGSYPFVDVLNFSRRSALAYIDSSTDQIFYLSASTLPGLLTETPQQISNESVFLEGPPVIRHGSLSSGVSLFYMGPGVGGTAPRDIWFDNSLNTQFIEEGSEGPSPLLSVYPTPFSELASITIRPGTVTHCRLMLFSMDGRLLETLFNGETDTEILQIGEDLPSGIYTVILEAGNSVESRRLVKL